MFIKFVSKDDLYSSIKLLNLGTLLSIVKDDMYSSKGNENEVLFS